MPEKGVPAPFGALPAHFFRGPEKSKICPNFAYFPWWAHGRYSPALGPLLLSTRGGAIGTFEHTQFGTLETSGKPGIFDYSGSSYGNGFRNVFSYLLA